MPLVRRLLRGLIANGRLTSTSVAEPVLPSGVIPGLSNSAAFEELWNASGAVLDPPPPLRYLARLIYAPTSDTNSSSEFGANLGFGLRYKVPVLRVVC